MLTALAELEALEREIGPGAMRALLAEMDDDGRP
jgi:hypothetical protein